MRNLIVNRIKWIFFLLSFKQGSFITRLRVRANSYNSFSLHYSSKIRNNVNFNFIDKSSRVSISKNTDIGKNTEFNIFGKLSIGDNSFINSNGYIIVGNSVYIGNNVLIGPYVKILGANHNFSRSDLPIIEQGHSLSDIIINDNVWVGANVIILPGVTIGRGAILAAGSVVTKNVNDNAIVAGNPARFIKERK